MIEIINFEAGMRKFGENEMSFYNLKNQNVNRDQYNAGRDISIGNFPSTSSQKAEISRAIADAEIEILQLKDELKKLEGEFWSVLCHHLSIKEKIDMDLFFTGTKKILEDDWLMLRLEIKLMSTSGDSKIRELRDKYKHKSSELKTRKEYLSRLQNELRYVNIKNVVSDITPIIKSFFI
ncbi:hypothetical protein [Okeania sp. SIO1I7]|uniref:hypothetical protein n=1 Tax=Okeania sp. SIO1I7 TaxID=2607772 RepID=UPI0013F938E0|nr:hypothetical protein [Okeania sp. SIO1I7]NET24827.1 hypothetical protein [Okeania sp. SIO1I7]